MQHYESTLETLTQAVQCHDFYFQYSDDHSKWLLGINNQKRIYYIIEALGHSEEAIAIFNSVAPPKYQLPLKSKYYLQDWYEQLSII